MKKVLSTLMAAGVIALVACGPSAEDKAAAEKAMQDSANAMMDTVATMAADTMPK
jgi:hypothetical protein